MKLFRYRRMPVPTIWSGFLLVVLFGLAIRAGLPAAHRFLAVNRPAQRGVFVIEGWISDAALLEAIALYRQGEYDRIYAVGGPIPTGARLSEYGTLAEMTAARLRAEGVPAEEVEAVPAAEAPQDRTRAAAQALRARLDEYGPPPAAIELVSVGTHARRSRRTYRSVMNGRTVVGIVSLPPQDYDPAVWWHTSAGFRAVLYEGLAYLHMRVRMPRANRVFGPDTHDDQAIDMPAVRDDINEDYGQDF